MAKVETFEDLEIWNRAINLYVEVYTKCENSGLKNDFSAKDQLKRATLSISNNIAEGFEYENNLQFMRYLKYSKGSAGEVRSMLHALYKTNQIDEATHKKLTEEVTLISKSIKNFLKYLSNHQKK
ncbi:MAG: four helix bundle protein [Candidatus Methylacidiphilales bacterium]